MDELGLDAGVGGEGIEDFLGVAFVDAGVDDHRLGRIVNFFFLAAGRECDSADQCGCDAERDSTFQYIHEDLLEIVCLCICSDHAMHGGQPIIKRLRQYVGYVSTLKENSH